MNNSKPLKLSPEKRGREVNEPPLRHYLAILSTFLIGLQCAHQAINEVMSLMWPTLPKLYIHALVRSY